MEKNQEFEPASFLQASDQDYGRPKKQQKYVSGENNGKWSQIQHAKYIAYIDHNKDKMRSKEKCRVSKLYKQMANYIKKRNAFQCRSHQQKLEDRHHFPNKIIAYYKKHNDLTLFNEFKLQLEELEPKSSEPCTLNVKLQEKNVEYASQTENRPVAPAQTMLKHENSTPCSPLSNEHINANLNGSGYVSWQTFEGNPFWGSFFIYPFYAVN